MRIDVTPFSVTQAKLFADLIYNIRDPQGQGKNVALLNASRALTGIFNTTSGFTPPRFILWSVG